MIKKYIILMLNILILLTWKYAKEKLMLNIVILLA